jgi:hypothetical protein
MKNRRLAHPPQPTPGRFATGGTRYGAMAGLLQRKRGRATSRPLESCFRCGRPLLPAEGAIEVEGRTFHETCLQGSIEGRAYQRLYGDRSGDVKPASGRRGLG